MKVTLINMNVRCLRSEDEHVNTRKTIAISVLYNMHRMAPIC